MYYRSYTSSVPTPNSESGLYLAASGTISGEAFSWADYVVLKQCIIFGVGQNKLYYKIYYAEAGTWKSDWNVIK